MQRVAIKAGLEIDRTGCRVAPLRSEESRPLVEDNGLSIQRCANAAANGVKLDYKAKVQPFATLTSSAQELIDEKPRRLYFKRFCRSCSSITLTPNSLALSSFEPASVPATT